MHQTWTLEFALRRRTTIHLARCPLESGSALSRGPTVSFAEATYVWHGKKPTGILLTVTLEDDHYDEIQSSPWTLSPVYQDGGPYLPCTAATPASLQGTLQPQSTSTAASLRRGADCGWEDPPRSFVRRQLGSRWSSGSVGPGPSWWACTRAKIEGLWGWRRATKH